MEEFIKNFADQFDDTPLTEFHADTEFHDLDEWSSLVGLAVLSMIAKKYEVKISPAELRNAKTVADVYQLIQNKKA